MPPLFIGNNIIELSSVDSTNSYAKKLLKTENPIDGTLVYAIEQTAGRGQAGNIWLAEKGMNITLSIILYPSFLEPDKQFFLNMAIALGIKDFCESIVGHDVKIKWPNDIYFEDQKLGGVLIENTISENKISASVVGIGINVNQESFDKSLFNATSLRSVSGRPYEIHDLIPQLCSYIEKYYLQLRQRHFNFLDKAYMVGLYRYQQTYEFRKGQQVFRGEINGVTKEGKLIIHSKGREQRFAFKEVEYII